MNPPTAPLTWSVQMTAAGRLVTMRKQASLVLLVAMVGASLIGLLAWGPVVLSPHAHVYADERALGLLPHACNVLTQLALMPLGLFGLIQVLRFPVREPMRQVWAMFFLCQMLATAGGMAYHWRPGDSWFVWDQVPKSAACALMSCAFLAERIDLRWGSSWAICAALLLSAYGGVWWWWTAATTGMGDLRPLLWLEFLPTLLVATGAWNLTGRLLTRADWLRSLMSFVFAQIVDRADQPIYLATGWISGHALRHLALTACVGWLAYRLGRVIGDRPLKPA